MSKYSAIQLDGQVLSLLKKNSLSVTESRRKILQLFLEQTGALAHGDIEKKAGEKFDRVTVYRRCRHLSKKESFIQFLPPIIQSAMHYAKTNARKDIIMIIISILFVTIAVIPIASMML